MIKLPKNINYVELYLTFKCPLRCSYCINGDVDRGREEISGDEWLSVLNKIDFGDTPLTLGGGEPTLHKDFYKIINGINKKTKIDLLTNLEFDIYKFMNNVPPDIFTKNKNPAYRSIRVSYHAEQMDPYELINKVKTLQLNGYPIGIFGINHPTNTQDNMLLSELARENHVYFFIKDFLGVYRNQLHGTYMYLEGLDGLKKQVMCKNKELLISPEGNLHKCHRDLYKDEYRIINILDKNFKITNKFRTCYNFGNCNHCDMKLKTNRFLKMGNCQVEIKK